MLMNKPVVVVVDHKDSFTGNLAELLRKVTGSLPGIVDYEQVEVLQERFFTHLILSPGPGLPGEFPSIDFVLQEFSNTKKILGVCLGHQGIARYFGGTLRQLDFPAHGRSFKIIPAEHEGLFKDLPSKFDAGFYHSWVVDVLPDELIPAAFDERGYIAALRHKDRSVFGVQFHPESFLTRTGEQILKNFLR
jgi:para-aminobenzoate synthetase component 2